MVIEWFGHSSFLIISSNGTKIITDPYQPSATLTYGLIGIPPDIVTVSHSHADHAYAEGLQNHFELISRPGVRVVRGIEFKGVESYHDSEEGALRGMNTMFVMNVDHIRICHLGDLGHMLSYHQIEELGEIDILLIPVGGHYTIGPAEADTVIDQLNPKIVIPMHYKTEKADMPIASVEEFLAGKENVYRLNASEFELIREQLPEVRQIGVLKHSM